MTKIIRIEGMACEHCRASAEKALNALENVRAAVDLAAKTATVELCADVSDDALRAAVEDAGFDVAAIDTVKD